MEEKENKNENENSTKLEFKYIPENDYEELRFSFFSEERDHYEKSLGWYILATLFTIVSVYYFIMDESFSSAIVFILILTVLFLFGNTRPRIVEIHFTNEGIYLNKRHYSYKNINTFWIITDKKKQIHVLYIEVGKAIIRTISIQLHDVPDYIIRESFRNNVKEDKEKEEPINSKIKRTLKL